MRRQRSRVFGRLWVQVGLSVGVKVRVMGSVYVLTFIPPGGASKPRI